MSVVFTGTYVEAHSRGEKSLKTAMQLWLEITRVCTEHNCYKVLGIAESTRGMPTLDAVEHQNLFKDLAIDQYYKVAWVELNPEEMTSVRFLETFIRNRGLIHAHLFADVDEARCWLLDESSEQDKNNPTLMPPIDT
ncbi:MAG: hypothetical protein C0616_00890 [Desulfuromonas sp.]|nr:MAG: hypothetical protein C0616_00890 [Desulfuromonas sp.]